MSRLLIVDPYALTRELLAALLREQDHQVDTASTAAEAIAALHARCPDLVVLEIALPDMDGLAVLSAIPAEHRPPTIVLAAECTREDVLRAVQLGVKDFILESSFTGPNFKRRIERLLAQPAVPAGATRLTQPTARRSDNSDLATPPDRESTDGRIPHE